MPATFHEHETRSGLKDRRKLSAFIDSVVSTHRKEVKMAALSYIFCTDAYLIEMNNTFLDHDTFTDIITFDLSESKKELQGEIYISVDRVRENAKTFKATYQQELHRVIFHGVLHLCGFKDKKPKDQQLMRDNEDLCLAQYKKELSK